MALKYRLVVSLGLAVAKILDMTHTLVVLRLLVVRLLPPAQMGQQLTDVALAML